MAFLQQQQQQQLQQQQEQHIVHPIKDKNAITKKTKLPRICLPYVIALS